MIALWILLGILFVILLALLTPIKVVIIFKKEFFVKIKLFGVKLFEIQPKADKKDNTPIKVEDNKTEPEKTETDSLFSKLKKKYGFFGAAKVVINFCRSCLTHIKELLRHIKIDKVVFDLTVCSDDAATTAIEYGSVCAAAYPMLSLLEACANIEYKEINIRSDFNSQKKKFEFSAVIGCNIIFLLIAAFKLYKEYKQFKEREDI